MPKQKRHKGLAKRVKITARKRVKRMACGKQKLMSHKPGTRRQRLRKMRLIDGKLLSKNILRALGEE